MDTVIIPAANQQDVLVEAEYRDRVRVVPVGHISEVLDVALVDDVEKASLLHRLSTYAVGPGRDRNRRSGPTPAPQ